MDAIEAEEARWLESVNNPDHPDHEKDISELNLLRLYWKQVLSSQLICEDFTVYI